MSESRPDDADPQSSPWQDNTDVYKNLANEDRDPRLIDIQQLWVFLETHKREKALGNAQMADEALRRARSHYEVVVAKHPHFPPDLRTRLNDLKREMDDLP